MSTRARWVVAAVGLVATVAVVVALNLPPARRIPHGRGQWVVQPGATLMLSADEVHPGASPGDEYVCPGEDTVVGTPERGHTVAGSGGLVISTLPDGTVEAVCEPDRADE